MRRIPRNRSRAKPKTRSSSGLVTRPRSSRKKADQAALHPVVPHPVVLELGRVARP